MNKSSRKMARKFRVLVDMDEVLADYDGFFLKCFRDRFPNEPFVPLEKRRNFYMSEDYKELESQSPGILEKLKEISDEEGFVRSLPPLPNSVEALKEMSDIPGVAVYICSSPTFGEKYHDWPEKGQWIEKYFGRDWLYRLILTKDKTMVYGDLLIDDKPVVSGAVDTPSWKHILFTNYHNRHVDLTSSSAVERLENWTDGKWRDVILRHMNTICPDASS